MSLQNCPNCGSDLIEEFYEVKGVPALDTALMRSREEALYSPKGDIKLCGCMHCGFVFNAAFDPSIFEYNAAYEETQGFSPTFSGFHQRLARQLVESHTLKNKTIIEIGCGKGEFLALLCEMGGNKGFGFDPAFVEGRNPAKGNKNVVFIKDFFSEKYARYKGDFYCCKMTLEHIPYTYHFVSMIRRCIGSHTDAIVCFLLPDAWKTFRELEFWDIYYEHSSYFSTQSLQYLFMRAGFDILKVSSQYDGQYLMLEARPARREVNGNITHINGNGMMAGIRYFKSHIEECKAKWLDLINRFHSLGKKVFLWGGSSKSVSFLTTLGITTDQIPCVIDINPYKQGTFLAGYGHKIIAPSELAHCEWDLIIVMNPIYTREIEQQLIGMGLLPKLLSIDFFRRKQAEYVHD